MLEQLFNSPFLYSLALTLLHFLWQGLLIALALKSSFSFVSSNKPQLRYALATVAMLTCLLLPIITFSIIYQPEVSLLSYSSNSILSADLTGVTSQQATLFGYLELAEFSNLLPYLALLWLTTIAILASKLLIEIYSVNQLSQQGSVSPDADLLARFNELAVQINLPKLPQLLISLNVDVPMAIGWLKPVVLLPASMISGLNTAQLEMLILHELAHIRRHDYLVNFLQTLVETLLFFHPAVAWISKQMRNEREYCSDDIAVHHCGDAVAYAHTLADTAALLHAKIKQKCSKHTIPTMAMAASGGDLKQRVVRLVDHHCAPSNDISKWFAGLGIIFSLLLLSSKPLLTLSLFDLWANNPVFKSTENPIFNNNAVLASPIPSLELATHTLAKQLLGDDITKTPPESLLAQTASQSETQVVESLVQDHLKYKKPSSVQAISQEVGIQPNAITERLIDNQEKNQRDKTARITRDMVNNVSTQAKINSVEKTFNNEVSTSASKNITTTQVDYSQGATETILTKTTKNNYKSAAELAFERTDSHNKNSVVSSSYASQVAALTTDYRPKETSFSNVPTNHNNNELTTDSPEAIFSTSLGGNPPSQVIVDAVNWQNAKQLKWLEPKYPSVAKRKGIEIDVRITFTISKNGRVKNLQFNRQNKISYFKNSIRNAVKKWRFKPAQQNGEPVESQMSKIFSFSLHG